MFEYEVLFVGLAPRLYEVVLSSVMCDLADVSLLGPSIA